MLRIILLIFILFLPIMANTSNLLMFAYVPPEYVVETIDYWADTLKLDGLIIGNICEWYSTEDDYFSRTEELIKFNNTCRDNGLAFNFLKIAIGYQEFPVWNDTLAINQKAQNLTNIFCWAKRVGFYGICIDTEPYTVPLWAPQAKRFEDIESEELKFNIYKFASILSDSITDMQLGIFLIPEGEYFYKNHQSKKYELWKDFMSGLVSNPKIGELIVGCEYTYKKTDYSSIKQFSEKLDTNTEKQVEYAFGAWPLGYYKSLSVPLSKKKIFINTKLLPMENSWMDKSPNYSPKKFKEQLDNFSRFSGNWIWIYSHGSAWWTLPNLNYSNIWKWENQLLETDCNIDSYIKVLKDFKKKNE